MDKFELSITPEYVQNWTVVDAVRELFQNALDQQTVLEDNKMFFDYSNRKLYIGNKKSKLEIRSLLLGESTKRENSDTIGKFGEGYKIATLVLLRLGKTVTFFNYGAKEVWRPRFVNSRRYGTKILTFFIDRKHMWQQVPDNDLTIVVDNVTVAEYGEIVKSNLHLQGSFEFIQTSYGKILKEPQHKGMVFVNGLYICTHEPYKYGYDFKPVLIRIDRDRKLVSDFDLKWLASQMWADVKTDEVIRMVSDGMPDVAYLNSILSYNVEARPLSTRALELFRDAHGDNAIPVSNQEDLARVPNSYRPVVVNETHKELISSSPSYVEPEYIPDGTDPLSKRFSKWLDELVDLLADLPESSYSSAEDLIAEFKELLIELKDFEE